MPSLYANDLVAAALRRYAHRPVGVTAARLGSCKLRRTDGQWRAEKPDWIARAEADLPGPAA